MEKESGGGGERKKEKSKWRGRVHREGGESHISGVLRHDGLRQNADSITYKSIDR